MKYKFLVVGLLIGVTGLFSFQSVKKKKLLDYFTNYKLDSLDISWTEYETIYDNPSVTLNQKGNCIDSLHFKVFELEGAEDLLNFSVLEKENGPMAYYKIKLDLGYYLLLIRSGGEYWNSRFYLCLYNSGDQHITSVVLAADALGDAGYAFTCTSKLKKVDKQWSIYTRQNFAEPFDYEKFGMDSIQITEIEMVTSIEMKDEHFFFVEKSKNEKSYIK